MSESATAFYLTLPDRDRLYLSFTADPVQMRRWLQSVHGVKLELHAYRVGRLGSILPQIFSSQAHKISLRDYWYEVNQPLLDFIANCKAAEFSGESKIPSRKPILRAGAVRVHASRIAALPEEFGVMAAVRVLSVSYWQMQKWIRAGMPVRRCGARQKFHRESMRSWLSENKFLAGK